MIDLTVTNDAVAAIYDESVDVIWLDAPNRRLQGVFDSRYFEAFASPDAEVGVSIKVVTMGIKNHPLGSPQVKERLVVRGRKYTITDKRPDGEGFAVLQLELTAT